MSSARHQCVSFRLQVLLRAGQRRKQAARVQFRQPLQAGGERDGVPAPALRHQLPRQGALSSAAAGLQGGKAAQCTVSIRRQTCLETGQLRRCHTGPAPLGEKAWVTGHSDQPGDALRRSRRHGSGQLPAEGPADIHSAGRRHRQHLRHNIRQVGAGPPVNQGNVGPASQRGQQRPPALAAAGPAVQQHQVCSGLLRGGQVFGSGQQLRHRASTPPAPPAMWPPAAAYALRSG